jgi:hypothetical protein
MARCPRCLKPVDEEQNCVDAHCGYRVEGSSLRPLVMIFVLVGMVHLALVWRIGVPGMEPSAPAMYWFFVGLCWLFVNGAATIAIYAAYVRAFELEPDEYAAWLRRGMAMFRAMARGTEFPARTVTPKSPSSRG